MYGHLREFPIDVKLYPFNKQLQTILKSFIIYNSDKPNSYNMNDDDTISKGSIFGFVLSYNNKPCFYELYESELFPCNQYKLKNLNTSLKQYLKTGHYKQFNKSTSIWGYTHMRIKAYTKECVLKFVQPNVKGKPETTKYPPGPGNVCIENNLFSKREILIETIQKEYPEVSELLNDSNLDTKKNICFFLELLLRNNKEKSFYSYDKVWLKYV